MFVHKHLAMISYFIVPLWSATGKSDESFVLESGVVLLTVLFVALPKHRIVVLANCHCLVKVVIAVPLNRHIQGLMSPTLTFFIGVRGEGKGLASHIKNRFLCPRPPI